MIRHSIPDDTPEIARLCLAQYKRTPWPEDMIFPVAMGWLINQRYGHVSACCGYRWDGAQIRVMHVWSEDGFRGRRAAVELMLAMQEAADAEGSELIFTARESNASLRNAVEQHGCEGSLGEEAGTVVYRRKARKWAVA